MKFSLPPLPYSYDALEPFYDAKTVEIHYTKHHQTYTDKLNTAIESASISWESIDEILMNLDAIPEDKRGPVRNHGGGYWNHTFFWESLAPNKTKEKREAQGELRSAIESQFGSFEIFKEHFTQKALNHFGSGWAWLVVNKEGKLEITDTHDQICPLSLGQKPLLTVDIWEHAYYLKYQNRRPEWMENFWMMVGWETIEKRFSQMRNG